MTLVSVNPTHSHWTRHRYILAFGAYGHTQLLVWANSLDDALDEAIDWIVDNAPGLLADEQVSEEYNAAKARGMSDNDAHEYATNDTICGGNCGNYILSWEWAIVSEDPDRATIKSLQEQP